MRTISLVFMLSFIAPFATVNESRADKCITALGSAGIRKCNTFVFAHNQPALAFWKRTGWAQRPDIVFLQRSTDRLDTQAILDA